MESVTSVSKLKSLCPDPKSSREACHACSLLDAHLRSPLVVQSHSQPEYVCRYDLDPKDEMLQQIFSEAAGRDLIVRVIIIGEVRFFYMSECERETEGSMLQSLGGTGNYLKRKRLTSFPGITFYLKPGIPYNQACIKEQSFGSGMLPLYPHKSLPRNTVQDVTRPVSDLYRR